MDENSPLERWKRFVDANNKEKQWMHERLNWLLGTQPVLFAALAASVYYQKECGPNPTPHCEAENDILNVIFYVTLMLGVLLSSAVTIALWAAGRMHWVWTTHLNRLAHALNSAAPTGADGRQEPVVPFGTQPLWPARTSSLIAPTLGIVFTGIWTALLFYLSGRCASVIGLAAASVIYIAVFAFIKWFHRDPAKEGQK